MESRWDVEAPLEGQRSSDCVVAGGDSALECRKTGARRVAWDLDGDWNVDEPVAMLQAKNTFEREGWVEYGGMLQDVEFVHSSQVRMWHGGEGGKVQQAGGKEWECR